MVIAITVLSTIVVILTAFLISAYLHILKIQKALQDLRYDNMRQDDALDASSNYLRDLALAIKDIQDYLVKKEQEDIKRLYLKNTHNKTIGEA